LAKVLRTAGFPPLIDHKQPSDKKIPPPAVKTGGDAS
jgi:hypothetical protein